MRRREFITLLGGAAAWPLTAQAQQPEHAGALAFLWPLTADDPDGRARVAAFLQTLHELGWIEGRNVRLDYRWAAGDARSHSQRRSGIGRARAGGDPGWRRPSPWLASASRPPGQCRLCSRSGVDPVGAGFVESLARPGGNATGFTMFEYGVSGEMARAAQGDRARPDASSRPSGCDQSARNRPVGRHPGRGVATRSGAKSDRRARRARDRARHRQPSRRFKWRPDRARRVGSRSFTAI